MNRESWVDGGRESGNEEDREAEEREQWASELKRGERRSEETVGRDRMERKGEAGERKERSGRESPRPKAGGGFRESFYIRNIYIYI